MLYQIVQPLIPVAFVIVLGFIAGKRGKLSQADSLLITRLVLNWIFPALLLAGMATTPRVQLLNFRFILATFIALLGTYAIAFAVGWYRFRELKASTLKGLVNGYPDAAFMGIPILQSIFGEGSLYPILVLNVIASLVTTDGDASNSSQRQREWREGIRLEHFGSRSSAAYVGSRDRHLLFPARDQASVRPS